MISLLLVLLPLIVMFILHDRAIFGIPMQVRPEDSMGKQCAYGESLVKTRALMEEHHRLSLAAIDWQGLFYF